MANACPRSTFVGSDYHDGSIAQARRRAEAVDLSGRVSFEVASAQTFNGGPYDLFTTFDALHDMGDPLGAARHVRDRLAADGTWMIVEPYAGCCSLGAQAGEEPVRRLTADAGFTRFRRVAETPFNIVYEARP
jgi:hypothetical protein